MSLNVSCAVPGCTNPVIGQCTGYKGTCGRFYCAAHSTDRLCADCARQKLEDEIAQRTYEDYLHTAERLQRKLRSAALPIVLCAGVIGILFFCSAFSVSPVSSEQIVAGWVMGMATILGGAIWAGTRQQKLEKEEVAEIGKVKPAFAEFYKAWKKEKSKEALMTALAIAGVIVAGAVAAAAAATSDDREKRVSEIEEGVRRAIR